MNIGPSLVAAVVLSVTFVPLTPSEHYFVASHSTVAAQATSSDVIPRPEKKLPRVPQVDVPNHFGPGEAKANEVSGAIGEIISGLDGFAGRWVDCTGLVHLAVQHGYSDEIKAILGDHFTGEFVVVEVQHSYKDLVERRDTISAQIDSLAKQDLLVMEWGPDEVHNTVRISLVNYTAAKAEQARGLLGQDIVVEPSMTSGGTNDLFSSSFLAG